jgi:hypothetical protein
MSLNWDLTKCDKKVTEEKEWPITNCLIWGTMIFNLHELTAENLKEWRWRIEFCKRCGMEYWHGPQDGKPQAWWPSSEDLNLRLGMHTNAETKTRKQWLKKITELLSEEVSAGLEGK